MVHFYLKICCEKKMISKEEILALYRNLEQILRETDFDKGTRQWVEKLLPNYLSCLEKRREDMEKCDHAIVIAGILNYVGFSLNLQNVCFYYI